MVVDALGSSAFLFPAGTVFSLRPGIVGMRGSMVLQTEAMHDNDNDDGCILPPPPLHIIVHRVI